MSTKLERLMHMDTMIRSGGYPSVQTFCDRFEVSPRTVYEDIQFLKRRLNAPLDYSRGRGGYFYVDLTWTLPTFLATEGQLLALLLSVELAHRYLGTSFELPLRDAIEHLLGALPAKVQVSLTEIASHYSVRPGATTAAPPETLMAIHDAIEHNHPIEILYFTAGRGEENHRTVDPYHLLNVRGEWHLVAYDHLRHAIRQFALTRIRTWRVLSDRHFEIDAAFSAESYFAQSFQAEHGISSTEVVIQFDEYQARYVRERDWHPSQQVEELPDGGLILRFTTGALKEVQRWVMSYGSHALVLAPESIARAIALEHEASAARYTTLWQTANISQ